MVSDRFFVAAEGGALRWRESADVVIGHDRPTVGLAVRSAGTLLSRAPGCALAAVPAGGSQTVFQTPGERMVLCHPSTTEFVCGVCVYPWLAAGYGLTELLARFVHSG